MADKVPVKAIFSGNDVTSLGEFASGDTIDVGYIADGTITAAKLAADTATQAELDTVSTVASAALPKAGYTGTTILNMTNAKYQGGDVSSGARMTLKYLNTDPALKLIGGGRTEMNTWH